MSEETGKAAASANEIKEGKGKEGRESSDEQMLPLKEKVIELGKGSQVVYIPRLVGYAEAWEFFNYLNKHIPWTRPTLRVFGRSCVQPRDTCYVAREGLPKLVYSGYQPHPHSWDDFPPLLDLLHIVQKALPGSHFNSLLLNRYKGGDDYVGWHSDDESLYGPTPEIASLSFGCDREFFLKQKTPKLSPGLKKTSEEEPAKKRSKNSNKCEQHSFILKHGSMLVMRGNTQRDWIHSVPKRAKVDAVRINLTFRLVL
ncbi:DNA oxidative demethylase ALKBH2 [Silene latifolia]|uniref:DNA oxidative demethylase ALKBH2 n=1 Tax=Silene latifolia TaxID=37657 RepID=UPI003D771269